MGGGNQTGSLWTGFGIEPFGFWKGEGENQRRTMKDNGREICLVFFINLDGRDWTQQPLREKRREFNQRMRSNRMAYKENPREKKEEKRSKRRKEKKKDERKNKRGEVFSKYHVHKSTYLVHIHTYIHTLCVCVDGLFILISACLLYPYPVFYRYFFRCCMTKKEKKHHQGQTHLSID